MSLGLHAPPIAVGRTAEIYGWGDGRVMKLYRDGSSREYVAREAHVSRLVHAAGLPAPAVFDSKEQDGLFEVGGRLGILYQRIDGSTMLRELTGRPWMVVAYAKALAALHAQVHAADGTGLPDLRLRIEQAIERAEEWLTPEILEAARRTLASLPAESRVCHGDFHPDNVLLTEEGPIIVDWGPASCGHPAADVAWTYLLFTLAGSPPGSPRPVRLAVLLLRRLALRIYVGTYEALTGRGWGDIGRWLGVVAVLRLCDRIPEERRALVRLIRERFSG